MTILNIEAHCIDAEFIDLIKKQYDVDIVDRSNEPWTVSFSGQRELLEEMVTTHWNDGEICSMSDLVFIEEDGHQI